MPNTSLLVEEYNIKKVQTTPEYHQRETINI